MDGGSYGGSDHDGGAPLVRACLVCHGTYAPGVRTCPRDGSALVRTHTAADGADPLLGTVLDGRYRVLRILGAGAMGSVYEGEQLGMERPVAIKVLKRRWLGHEDVVKRFQREVKAVASLTHPNTVTVYDHGQTTSGDLYLAMEYSAGRSLEDAIGLEGAMTPLRALAIAWNVAASLSEAHAKGIIHRDLKPANVLLVRTGSSGTEERVRLIDFGVAKILGPGVRTALTQSSVIVGTPAYMSPEQARGATDVDHLSDIYALGCILYECLAGQIPFRRDSSLATLRAHIEEPAPSLAGSRAGAWLPPDVDGLVHSMLAKEPSVRPRGASDVQARIEAIVDANWPGSWSRSEHLPPPPAEDVTGIVKGASGGFEVSAYARTMMTAGIDPTMAAPSVPATPAIQAAQTDLGHGPAGAGRRSTALLVAGVAGVLVVTAAVVLLLAPSATRPPRPSAAASAPRAATEPPAESAPPTDVWLTTTPTGAIVRDGDRVLGETPLRLDRAARHAGTLSLKKSGYLSVTVAVPEKPRGDISVDLQRSAEPAQPAEPDRPSRKRRRTKKRTGGGAGMELKLK